MNIAERKLKLVEKILDRVNEENVDHFEEIIENEILNEEVTVAYTIAGEPISANAYKIRNQNAIKNYEAGIFKTSAQLKEKYKSAKN